MGSPQARFQTEQNIEQTGHNYVWLEGARIAEQQHMAVLIGDKPVRVLSDDGERGLVPWSLRSNRQSVRPVQRWSCARCGLI